LVGSARGRCVRSEARPAGDGAKGELHCRHIVLLAAAYSCCLKPQCGHSTLTLTGDDFATVSLKKGYLMPVPRALPSLPAPVDELRPDACGLPWPLGNCPQATCH